MKKVIFAFIVLSLLIISGCKEDTLTGKSVIDAKEDLVVNEKISECVKSCSDGSQSTEEFLNSCTKILQYGGEKVFNEYVEVCKK